MRTIGTLLIALMIACVFASAAQAHPLGNFTINHLAKVRVEPGAVAIRYIVDMAEIPTFQVMRERSIEGRRRNARLEEWARDEIKTVKSGLIVQADGQNLSLQSAIPHANTRPGAGGLPTLYFVDEFHAEYSKPHARHTITIRDQTYSGRIGWKDIVVEPNREPTNELRSYPSALLGSPRAITYTTVTLGADGRVLAQQSSGSPLSAPAGSPSQVRSNLLSDMLARGASNPWLVLATVLIAMGLGALHALEPGHGKTLLAVSLVGARATPKQALLLALALTIAHTAGVLALGVMLLLFAQWIVPENVYPWIALASGILVAILGAGALSRLIKLGRGHSHDHAHSHAHHPHPHDHHAHQLPTDGGQFSFRGIVLIAMSGNIAPCPAALVVLLTALSLHQAGYGLVVVVAFSIGLASVLTGLGIAVVRGASWFSRRSKFDRIVRYAPLFTASVISIVGATMVAKGAASALQAPELPVMLLALAAIAGFAFSPGHSHALKTETT